MNITGSTALIVNGRTTRVCGNHFNRAFRKHGDDIVVLDSEKRRVIPSGKTGWKGIVDAIRASKTGRAKLDK